MKKFVIALAATSMFGSGAVSVPALADVTFNCKIAYPDQSAVEIDAQNRGPELANCVATCTATAANGSTHTTQWGATVPAGFDGSFTVDGPHPDLAPLKNPTMGNSSCTPPR
jgi:hypothetical protein